MVPSMKFAVISHVLPPSSSGQAIVLHRLLKDLDPKIYCLISQRNYNSEIYRNYTGKLRGRYYKVLTELRIRNPVRLSRDFLSPIGSAVRLINVLIAFLWVPIRAVQIARILSRENCNAAITCTADLINMPAGYLASRIVGISYYPYIFDYYSYQWTEPFSRLFASLFEPVLLKGAEGIIVPNEFLRNELMDRYGVEAAVVHNPFEALEVEEAHPWPSKEGEVRIVYTGAIYYVHYDAFRNLLAAIEQTGRNRVMLHIYTGESHSKLESEGIRGPVIYHDHLKLSDALKVQMQADILFLSLAFESSNQEIVKTSSPGKMGEYLASGRPVLVHAPSDSFVSWYFREHDCGVVVDERDIDALANAINGIIESKELRNRLVAKALLCAREDFDLASARAKFLNVLSAKKSSPVFSDLDSK
jgi:glycosyltransferase involved in cell wall biosynthesis